MHKVIGYVLAGVGVVGLAASTFSPQTFQETIGLGKNIADTTITIASLIVTAVGIIFLAKGKQGSKQASEVPIYHGKNVVGYRRLGK